MKENVIRELLETEENYVKLLSSLCVGYANHVHNENANATISFSSFIHSDFAFCSYLKPLRQHSTVFPTESLILIFSNIEKIFRFQQKFLDALRDGIERNKIAEKFVEYVSISSGQHSIW